MNPCKHLDFNEATYGGSCELVELSGFSCPVKHWRRKPHAIPYDGAPVNVQFCGQGLGRINGIFDCYNPGERPCYEPSTANPTTEGREP